MFSTMVDKNSPKFQAVYLKAGELFDRLLSVQEKFKDWVVLGTVDMEKMAEEHLETVTDWEVNFKAIKIKGREAEKLPL